MALQADEHAKQLGDALSIITVVGTLTELIPAIAAILTIIWTAIRIWETDTVQRMFGKKENTNADSRD
jgi:FtsH-binding integral membrane protein